jgi:hypothetical protein
MAAMPPAIDKVIAFIHAEMVTNAKSTDVATMRSNNGSLNPLNQYAALQARCRGFKSLNAH